MDAAVALPVEISEWKPAPFALGGETVFAIGDVHGCAAELRVLLDAIARLAGEAERQAAPDLSRRHDQSRARQRRRARAVGRRARRPTASTMSTG